MFTAPALCANAQSGAWVSPQSICTPQLHPPPPPRHTTGHPGVSARDDHRTMHTARCTHKAHRLPGTQRRLHTHRGGCTHTHKRVCAHRLHHLSRPIPFPSVCAFNTHAPTPIHAPLPFSVCDPTRPKSVSAAAPLLPPAPTHAPAGTLTAQHQPLLGPLPHPTHPFPPGLAPPPTRYSPTRHAPLSRSIPPQPFHPLMLL